MSALVTTNMAPKHAAGTRHESSPNTRRRYPGSNTGRAAHHGVHARAGVFQNGNQHVQFWTYLFCCYLPDF